RFALVKPARVRLAPPVTASAVLLRVTPVVTPSTSVSAAPLMVPPPVQPVTVKVWVLPVSVRLAVVIPDRLSAILSVADGAGLDSVKLAFLPAATVAPAAPLAVSAPPPVQPPTVKVWPPVGVLSVRWAVAIPLRLNVAPGAVNCALVSVNEPAAESATVPVPALAVSDPVPVQPVRVNVLLVELAPVSFATVIPLRLSGTVGEAPVSLPWVRGYLDESVSTRLSPEPVPERALVPGPPLRATLGTLPALSVSLPLPPMTAVIPVTAPLTPVAVPLVPLPRLTSTPV